jgi:16S rRNA (cytidine1402-2'-O)-methyltransferase
MALFIVATPIGTLGDLSIRARQVLAEVDAIAAEDTRTTRHLLNAVGIDAPRLIALHAHNEGGRAEAVVQLALTGNVALVSDAGTPAVSDPGGMVVEAALAAGVEIRSVPGPSALAAALGASGFAGAPSLFLGFAPRKGRDGFARQALSHGCTVVIYEAPGRIVGLVAALAAVQPARPASLCREISKRYEEVVRAPLAELAQALAARERIKGECVLVVGPGEPFVQEVAELDGGARLKDVAALLAEQWGVPKREVYSRLNALRDALSGSE